MTQPITHRILIAGTGYGVGKSLVLRSIAAYQAATGSVWATAALTQEQPGTMDLAESWRSLQASPPAASPAIASSTAGTAAGLLIDGVGSLGTPVTPESTLADLAWDWRLPTLLVTAVTPHCLDDLVAHAALARQTRCDVRGIVLNCTTAEAEVNSKDWASPRQVSALTQLPVLGQMPYCSELANGGNDPSALSEAVLAEMGATIDVSELGMAELSRLSA